MKSQNSTTNNKMSFFEFVAIFSLSFGICFYWFYPSLTTNLTFSRPGDGWGTIGWIFDVIDNYHRYGSSILLGDLYQSQTIGAGISTFPNTSSPFWKTYFVLAGTFLTPPQIYNLTVFLSFFANFICAYYLARVLNLKILWAMFAALLFANLDNTWARAIGHMTLVGMHGVPLIAALSIRAAQYTSYRRMIFMAIGLVVSFISNEYYGYFSLFTMIICFAVVWLGRCYANLKAEFGDLSKKGFVSGGVFLFLLSISYPNLIGKKFIPFASNSVLSQYHHDAGNSSFYTTKNFFPVIKPRLETIKSIAPSRVLNAPNPPEFTFHAGFLAFILSLFALLTYLPIQSQFPSTQYQKGSGFLILAIALCGYCGYMLAMHPSQSLSLAKFTQKHFSMFRVHTRALLLPSLALVMLATFCIQIWEGSLQRWLKKIVPGYIANPIVFSMSITLGYFTFLDTTSRLPTDHITHGLAPFLQRPTVNQLSEYPDGVVVELPFFAPPTYTPERDYDYIASRMFHKKPIMNGLSFKGDAHHLRRIYDTLQINHITPARVADLQRVGVRYIIVNHGQGINQDDLEKLPILDKILSDNKVSIFEFKDPQNFKPELLRSIEPSSEVALTFPVQWFHSTEIPRENISYAEWPKNSGKLARIAHFDGASGHMSHYAKDILAPGYYKAIFHLSASNLTNEKPPITIDVFDMTHSNILASRDIAFTELNPNKEKIFEIYFEAKHRGHWLEPRVRLNEHGTFYHVGSIEIYAASRQDDITHQSSDS